MLVRDRSNVPAVTWLVRVETSLDCMIEHTSELERLLCSPMPIGSIEDLVPRVADAWQVRFPDLATLPSASGPVRRLKVCIATEDIVGPVRNGGIGTTYAALAELLAKLGHQSTILYLRGQEVETGDIDHWIRVYAAKGVAFVPVPNYAEADEFRTNADRWLRAPYNMLRYLLEHPQDVVHVSEWRGSAYLSLLAKRQGLAFADTLFIVKTSSPWMWNRLYGSQPLDRLDDLAKVHAERQSVELADMVVGGSLHLLRWMSSQGYRLARDRTFVQPNVVSFDNLQGLLQKRRAERGARMPIDEIVFFGRLEARKGLFIFCEAVKRLIRLGVPLPRQITFMGKPGARLTARPGQSVLDYIEAETRNWPTEVKVLPDFQQYEALEYLLDGPRLAVMPSVIENSSMAIYEAAICGIPCVATNVGGNTELVDEGDWPHLFCPPHPIGLADKMAEALVMGGLVPTPSFDNHANLQTWRDFHTALACGLREKLLQASAVPRVEAGDVSVSVCLYVTGDEEALRASLVSLARQAPPQAEVLIGVDADDIGAPARVERIARDQGVQCRILEAFDLDAGAAFNRLAERAAGEFVLFLWEGATLKPDALQALRKVALSSGADVLNYFYRVVETAGRPAADSPLKALVVGSMSDAFFRNDVTALPLFVRKTVFDALGGFTSDYRVLGHDYEFMSKAQLGGYRCETALLELGTVKAWNPEWLSRKCYDVSLSQFRAIRPQLAATPLGMRDLLLISKGLQERVAGPKRSKAVEVSSAATDGPFVRMMQAMMADGPKAAPRKSAAPPKHAVPKPSSASPRWMGGLAQLVDGDEFRPVKRSAERPAKRAAVPPPKAQVPALVFPRPDVSASGSIRGQLLCLHQGHLFGWAADLATPARVLELELSLGRHVRRWMAGQSLPTVAKLPPELDGHGFVIPLPVSHFDRLVRPAGRRLVLKVLACGLDLAAALDFDPLARPAAGAAVEGYCDAGDHGRINGWVWRPGHPGEQVDVAVFADERLLARVRADRSRDDLRRQGIGEGDHGFSIALPQVLLDGRDHRIDVVAADCGTPLKRSPVFAHGRAVRLSETMMA